MVKNAVTVACVVLLSACSSLPDWVTAPQFSIFGTNAELGHYSFDWRLSGERQVAPLQVFDNGNKIWLQFMPEQPIPAIFQNTPEGERPLRYKRDGDYLVLDGVWPKLSFRGGSLVAYAERNVTTDTASVQDLVVSAPPAASPAVVAPQSDTRVIDTAPVSRSKASDADIRRLTSASFASTRTRPLVAAYGVTMLDQNLRRALNRWATQASWTFGAEHWTVDVDIPISGEATFGHSFEESVQDLLAATELAERPLRPCFYSNRVLRVVPYSQSCNRSTGVRES